MPDRITIRRAVRKLVRPVRRLLRQKAERFELDALRGPVLVVVAHPDDEAFCSGLICALGEAGTEVQLLCMTRGEGGEHADGDARDLGAVREREMLGAAAALGVEGVRFLGYVDPANDGMALMAPEVDTRTLASQIAELVRELGCSSIVTHGSSGEYWHPAHLALHDAARVVADEIPQLQVWTFNAWDDAHPLSGVLNRDDPAQLRVDAGPYHERRLAALRRHVSQRAVFERFAGSDLETFVRNTEHEGYHLACG